MDRHALYGVINEKIERPSRELVEALGRYSVRELAEVTEGRGVMNHEIKPLSADLKCAGPAVTLFGRQGDTLMIQRVGDCCEPGDVVVADVAGVKSLSVTGERLTSYIYNVRGAAGVIIDGAIRDHAGLKEMGVPIFFRGVDPKLFGALGPGAINVQIQAGGVIVNPGDLIVGDRDGVICIPKEDMEAVLAALEARR
ncbi:MAG: hypothetical protein IJ831_08985 [Spirochaetales bacterium]|nr:hypothetical protein [Spirochaetales bacterium]